MKTFFQNGAQTISETCPPMNQTHATPCPDNILANDTNSLTPRDSVWKYETKIFAPKSYVLRKLSTLHNKIDRFFGNL